MHKTHEEAEIHICKRKNVYEPCYVYIMLIIYDTGADKSQRQKEISRGPVKMVELNMYSMESVPGQKILCTIQYF